MVDAQAAEDYVTYIVTLGGNELQETDPNPLVTQLLSQAQDLTFLSQKLMVYFRRCFPTSTFLPKMHILEDHVVPFTRKLKFPLGFFGEQGGESIHHDFVSLAEMFSRLKPATYRLKKMLEEHFIVTSPSNREIVPTKPSRNQKE